MTPEIARRLVAAAYEKGWRNACDDFRQQDHDKSYPIGRGKRDLDDLLILLDPYDLTGLRATHPTSPSAQCRGEGRGGAVSERGES